jgi:hypothetical protein
MATTTYPTQYAKPSEFMAFLAEYLASKLGEDLTEVRIVSDEKAGVNPHKAGSRMVLLSLGNPVPTNPNAGAGRHGFPTARKLMAKLGTRNVSDAAGDDTAAMIEHWDFQDAVIDALLLEPTAAGNVNDVDDVKRFLTPIKLVGGDDDVKRIKGTHGQYESVLVFEVNYAAKVTRP